MSISDLAGKTFIVTAAASGIGLATTTLLIESGANVGMCDIDKEALAKFASSLGPDAKAQLLTGFVDVASRLAVQSFIKSVKDQFGRLDGVASVAGGAGRQFGAQNLWDVADDEFDYIMNVNIRGLFNILTESLSPGVMNRPGSIVHVGSEFSLRGARGSSLYSTAKHGCLGMIKSVALECGGGQNGVRVNAVLPGPTNTPGRRAALQSAGIENDTTKKRPIGRPAEPSEIANIILFLLSEKSSFVTGAAWTADGGSPI